jgi:hypothetical protein
LLTSGTTALAFMQATRTPHHILSGRNPWVVGKDLVEVSSHHPR